MLTCQSHPNIGSVIVKKKIQGLIWTVTSVLIVG